MRETPWTTFGNQSYKYICVKLMFIYIHIYLYDFGYIKNMSRETEREEDWERVGFFCLKESIWGLSVLSLVLSCTPDTLSRVSYLFQFQNCQIYTPLVLKAFELDKNYSCEWGFINCYFLPLLEDSGALAKCVLSRKALFNMKFECSRELFQYAINMQIIFRII